MKCPKCGKENSGGSQFCIYCGTKFSAGSGQQGTGGARYQQQPGTSGGRMNQQTGNQGQNMNAQPGAGNQQPGGIRGVLFGDMRDTIIEPDEKVQGSLKNNMMANIFLSWSVRERDFFFTDKRLYFKEKRFHKMGLSTTDTVVDLDDISLISVENHNPFWYLVLAGIMLLIGLIAAAASSSGAGIATFFGFLVLALVGVAVYFKLRGATLNIYFQGGSERIGVAMYSYQDVLAFEKGLKKACIQSKREKNAH